MPMTCSRGKQGKNREGGRKMGWRCGHSLRVELVEGSVHTHCHFQSVQPTVFSYFVHHGGHACATELGCPPRHDGAHLLDDDAVVTGALEPQVVQDSSDLEQGQAVTGVGGRQQVVSHVPEVTLGAGPFRSGYKGQRPAGGSCSELIPWDHTDSSWVRL